MESDLSANAHGGATTPMNGTLEDTTPAGVLQVLSSQRETGAVRFLGESGCTVYLHEGELYFAESAETAEDLSVALVRPGRLTPQQWDACTEEGYPTETVGESLIGTGAISQEMLASIVLSVIYDPLIQLFRAPEGDYEFAPGVVHWIGTYRTFSVDAIVAEVRRRTREADEMAPIIPSLDSVVQSARSLPETHGSVNLRRDDWEVVVAAATGKSINELAIELGRGRWSTARLVYRLATADLLAVSSGDVVDDDLFGGGSESSFDAGSAFDSNASFDTGTGFDAGSSFATDTNFASEPTAFDSTNLSAGPPPLDTGAFLGDVDVEPEPWAMPESEQSSSWDLAESAEPTTDDWGLPQDDADTDWMSDTSFTDDESDTTTETDDWSAPSLSAVPDVDDTIDDGGFAAEPSTDDPFGASGLHPDIAKALAESTYADSATAINAMAARLGASDDDDEDDWDTGSGEGDGDDFWSAGEGEDGSESFDFIWKPAVWETGVESTPLPQREHVARAAEPITAAVESSDGEPVGAPQVAPAQSGGSADPEWLDSLYTQFMPGEGGAKQPGSDGQGAPAGEGGAPKKRSIKRLMSAFKRL